MLPARAPPVSWLALPGPPSALPARSTAARSGTAPRRERQGRITALPPAGPEGDGKAPCRGLQHRMQACPPEPPTDIRDGPRAVQRRESTDPINQEERGR